MLVSFFDNWNFVTGVDYSFKKGSPEIPYIASIPEVAEVLDDDGKVVTPYQPAVDKIPGQPEIPDQGRIDCIKVIDIDFDPTTQTVRLEWTEVVIEDIPPPPESPESIRARVTKELIQSPHYEEVDTEWVTGFDIDSLVLHRFFKWDRGAESGYNQDFSYILSLENPTTEQIAFKERLTQGYIAKKAFVSYIKSL